MPSRPASNAASAATTSSAGQRSNRDRISDPTRSGASAATRSFTADEREHADDRDAACGHHPLERASRSRRSSGQDEHRQRTGRVLDGEVAVGDAMVVDDRGAVALVGRPVDERAVRPEPRVDETEAREEQSPAARASAHRWVRVLTFGSRDRCDQREHDEREEATLRASSHSTARSTAAAASTSSHPTVAPMNSHPGARLRGAAVVARRLDHRVRVRRRPRGQRAPYLRAVDRHGAAPDSPPRPRRVSGLVAGWLADRLDERSRRRARDLGHAPRRNGVDAVRMDRRTRTPPWSPMAAPSHS